MKRKAYVAVFVGLFCSMGLLGCSSSIEGIEQDYPPGKTEMIKPKGVNQFESKARLARSHGFNLALADDISETQSRHGRILAAGGYITGAVAGS